VVVSSWLLLFFPLSWTLITAPNFAIVYYRFTEAEDTVNFDSPDGWAVSVCFSRSRELGRHFNDHRLTSGPSNRTQWVWSTSRLN
jgi:hypothetical protein